jgi:uncharacterized protein YqhQ
VQKRLKLSKTDQTKYELTRREEEEEEEEKKKKKKMVLELVVRVIVMMRTAKYVALGFWSRWW